MPDMDYSKLLGRIREKGFTQEGLSIELHQSRQSINNKLNGRTPFSAEDIVALSKALEISYDEVGPYFFTPKVEKTQLSTVNQGA